MNDLTVGGFYIIVITVQPNEPRAGQDAVLIVVQASILGNNAVLYIRSRIGVRIGINDRRINHLTIRVKRIRTSGKKIVGISDPIASSMYYLAGGRPDIVVVIADLDQARAGQDAVHIVVQASILGDDAVFRLLRENNLTSVIKGIDARVQQAVCLGDPVATATHKGARGGSCVIVRTIDQHQAVGNDNTVNAIVIIGGAFIEIDSSDGGVRKVRNDAVFTEGVIDSAGQRQSVGLLNEILVLFCRSLAGLRIFSEVVIVDLAVLLDNALQAGFFLDDAAVEPIGIISDAVNTGNIFLEHTLAVKDAAGFFRCSIGDQRRDSGSRVSGFGVQIVGIAVNDGPTGLLQFAVLVVLLAVYIRKPAVGMLPAGLEGQIGKSKQF